MRPPIDFTGWCINERHSDRATQADDNWHAKNPKRRYRMRRLLRGELGQSPHIAGVVVVCFLPDGEHLRLYEHFFPGKDRRECRLTSDMLRQAFGHLFATDEAIEAHYGELFSCSDAILNRGAFLVGGNSAVIQ